MKSEEIFAGTPPSMHSTSRLIGPLSSALKLQDHPGEGYKGFLSCVPAFNLRQHRRRP